MTAKRDGILSAAMRLFAENGYHSTGVDKIAAASGASKMTLYSQFGSKEHLITEVLQLRDEQFLQSLTSAMAKSEPGIARLKALFEWHEEWFRQPEFHGCMFIKASEEFAGESEPIMEVSRRHKVFIRRLIEDCLIQADMNNAAHLASLLFILLEGMIVNAHMFGAGNGIAIGWSQIEHILRGAQASGT